MPNFFFFTTYGRTASYWLASILNKHPDIICSHGPTIPPKIDLDDTMPRSLSTPLGNVHSFKISEIIEEHKKLGTAKFYGNVHAFTADELYMKCIAENLTIPINLINIIRHPITRLSSVNTMWAAGNTKEHLANLEASFVNQAQVRENIRYVEKTLGQKNLSYYDKVFIGAATSTVADVFEFSIPIKRFVFERLITDFDYLIHVINEATDYNLDINNEYIKILRETPKKNHTSMQYKSAREIFMELEPWKKDFLSYIFTNRNLFSLYRELGYDFSMIEGYDQFQEKPQIIFYMSPQSEAIIKPLSPTKKYPPVDIMVTQQTHVLQDSALKTDDLSLEMTNKILQIQKKLGIPKTAPIQNHIEKIRENLCKRIFLLLRNKFLSLVEKMA
jgi:hypothetical protein